MSFADKMRTTSDDKKAEIEKLITDKAASRKLKQDERVVEVRDQMFTALTTKYHAVITRGINNAAKNGNREKYMNFARDDFKANCPGLGFPQEVQANWLIEMCNPDSKYLPVAENSNDGWNEGDKMHIDGVKFNVWNNRAFTVLFTW